VRASQELEVREGVSEVSSVYAAEGTTAHSLAELLARCEILEHGVFDQELEHWRDNNRVDDESFREMLRHAESYVAYLQERMALHPYTQLLLEQRVETGLPSCWGTGDAIMVSPSHVEIVDYKYGSGVRVSAWKNPQIMLYGVGALDTYGEVLGTPEMVYCTIFQPRIDNVSTYEISPSDLRAWRDSLEPIAEEARGPNARFGPSESACRWCPVAGQCRAQLEWALALDFGHPPDLLSVEELSEALTRIPAIRVWCDAVQSISLDLAYSKDTHIPGWKVVLSGGKRYITDPAEAIRILVEDNGFELSQVSKQTILGIGDLEKMLGKAGFEESLGGVVAKTEGKPSLVPEDDKRSAINPNSEASKDFA
jgi:RecB family exonuclease